MDQTVQSRIKEVLTDILGFLGIDFSVEFIDSVAGGKSRVVIKSTDDSLLVGYHGNNLNSLQYILNIFISKEFEGDNSIVLDIGDYRTARENKLRDIAFDAANKSKELGKPVSLYPMSSYERRIVHEVVTNVEGMHSYSEGEGRERKVIITVKED
jgi:spoIIIJ-associated protein